MSRERPVSEIRKRMHAYLASHPEIARVLRRQLGIKLAARDDDAVGKLAREIAKRKKE